MSRVLVMKFGGAALGTPKRIRRAARRVARWRERGWSPVVVVSACARTTDRILDWLSAVTGTTGPRGREADRALATGEELAAGLLAAALEARGVPSVSMGAREAGIVGAGPHGEARIAAVRADALRRRIDEAVVPVVAGFQGATEAGEIVTLGRGGSDLTAVHVAAALGARECHLVKDVPGIHDRDPRRDPAARLLPRLHPRDVEAIARAGAQVVHPEAARTAGELLVTLRVYGYRDPVFGGHGSTVSVATADNGSGVGDAARREAEARAGSC